MDYQPADLCLRSLKEKLETIIENDKENYEDYEKYWGRHKFFVITLIKNFDEIFKTPITDETFSLEEVKLTFQEDSDDNKWNYEVVMFGKYHYFCCNTYHNLHNLLKHYAIEEEELYLYTPAYLHSFLKDEYKIIHHKDIDYPEPDLECDEDDIPLYDTDDCPCCMEKFGITEKQELIGNHSKKKILKTTKTICVKRNTYCGHPICIECFKTICNSDNVKCPMCREDYEETGDVEINEWGEVLTIEDITNMADRQDDMLLDMVYIDELIEQSICADGWSHMLRCEGFVYEDCDYFFGKDED
jgi:hypothetical protein